MRSSATIFVTGAAQIGTQGRPPIEPDWQRFTRGWKSSLAKGVSKRATQEAKRHNHIGDLGSCSKVAQLNMHCNAK